MRPSCASRGCYTTGFRQVLNYQARFERWPYDADVRPSMSAKEIVSSCAGLSAELTHIPQSHKYIDMLSTFTG